MPLVPGPCWKPDSKGASPKHLQLSAGDRRGTLRPGSHSWGGQGGSGRASGPFRGSGFASVLDQLHFLPANQVLTDSGQKAGNCTVEGGLSAALPASSCHGNSWSAMWPQRSRNDPCETSPSAGCACIPCLTEQSNSYCGVSSFIFCCHSAARSIKCTQSY